jgi:predicted oxidoreductase
MDRYAHPVRRLVMQRAVRKGKSVEIVSMLPAWNRRNRTMTTLFGICIRCSVAVSTAGVLGNRYRMRRRWPELLMGRDSRTILSVRRMKRISTTPLPRLKVLR